MQRNFHILIMHLFVEIKAEISLFLGGDLEKSRCTCLLIVALSPLNAEVWTSYMVSPFDIFGAAVKLDRNLHIATSSEFTSR